MRGQQNITTLTICNTHCSYSTTMVVRTHLIFTLHVRWVYCCVSRFLQQLKAHSCCLRRGSAAADLLILWVRIPPVAWMFFVSFVCVILRAGMFDELITRPGESYRLWCVVVCGLETSWMRTPWPALGRNA